MLRQRLLTAAVLGLVVVWATLALPTAGLGVLLAGVILLGAWEWSRLLFAGPGRAGYCLLIAGLLVAVGSVASNSAGQWLIVVAGAAYWCGVVVWLYRYLQQLRIDPVWLWAGAGAFTLVPPWATLMALHAAPVTGPVRVLFLLILVGLADSAAYFAGRRWGRRKLVPRISPGKTWAGVLGAGLVTLLAGAAGAGLLGIDSRAGFMLCCLVTVAFSIIGDLLESMFKRQHGVKDSGSLLPGHGGVLDRIDSLTAAAPIFFLGLRALSE